MKSRRLPAFSSALFAAALLAGCAAMKNVTSEVSTYGEWPAGRAPGSYAIERLPSQQKAGPEQDEIEQGARQALETAGFTPVVEGAAPDVVVQIGARITRFDRAPWDDPLWWHPYGGRWFGPAWAGPYPYGPYSFWAWRMRYDRPEYLREVGLLIRDRATGRPLYEARARNDGITSGSQALIGAMFVGALKDFPNVKNEPHDVAVQLP